MPEKKDIEKSLGVCPVCGNELIRNDNGKLHCLECGQEREPKK